MHINAPKSPPPRPFKTVSSFQISEMSYSAIPVVQASSESKFANIALSSAVAVVTMTVVYTALSMVTAPATTSFPIMQQARPSMALSAGNSVRVWFFLSRTKIGVLQGGFQDWLKNGLLKSSSVSDGWPGYEEDLKAEKKAGTASRTVSRTSSRAATTSSKKTTKVCRNEA